MCKFAVLKVQLTVLCTSECHHLKSHENVWQWIRIDVCIGGQVSKSLKLKTRNSIGYIVLLAWDMNCMKINVKLHCQECQVSK